MAHFERANLLKSHSTHYTIPLDIRVYKYKYNYTLLTETHVPNDTLHIEKLFQFALHIQLKTGVDRERGLCQKSQVK